MEDIRDILLEEKETKQKFSCYPLINVSVGTTAFIAVLDSGSPVSVISEDVYGKYREILECPTLPLRKIKIQGAISSKSVDVKQQICLDFKCQGHDFTANLLIVPLLSTQIILGNDFLNAHKAILNFNDAEVDLQIQGKSVTLKFDNCISDHEEDVNCLCFLREHLPHFMSDFSEDALNNIYDSDSNKELYLDFNSVIQDKVNNVEQCSEDVRTELFHILQSNAAAFKPGIGTIKGFQYKFQVKQHEPFCVPPYRIPFQYRERVKAELQSMLSLIHI